MKAGEAQSDGWELPPRARGSVACAEDRSAPGELGLPLNEGRARRERCLDKWSNSFIRGSMSPFSVRSEYLQAQAYEHMPASSFSLFLNVSLH